MTQQPWPKQTFPTAQPAVTKSVMTLKTVTNKSSAISKTKTAQIAINMFKMYTSHK